MLLRFDSPVSSPDFRIKSTQLTHTIVVFYKLCSDTFRGPFGKAVTRRARQNVHGSLPLTLHDDVTAHGHWVKSVRQAETARVMEVAVAAFVAHAVVHLQVL